MFFFFNFLLSYCKVALLIAIVASYFSEFKQLVLTREHTVFLFAIFDESFNYSVNG